ncbi:unnamed protein product [Nippostrongylus brasiliensis]|uniref:PIR Superfamily Protein n=1 Tax=Nippostrongylus brasiliensis TaxID=27835 RepID=A0A0N4YF47_NIPBR|nr:unnamed protein product [Nippostrongylus brasiliensis]
MFRPEKAEHGNGTEGAETGIRNTEAEVPHTPGDGKVEFLNLGIFTFLFIFRYHKKVKRRNQEETLTLPQLLDRHVYQSRYESNRVPHHVEEDGYG